MGEKKGNTITSKVAIPAGGEKRERRHKRKAEENETGRKTGRKVFPQNDLKSFYKKNNWMNMLREKRAVNIFFFFDLGSCQVLFVVEQSNKLGIARIFM